MDPEGRLAVQAVFATIQGEGPNAGQPAVFVRLAGCNLRCWFCDTDFESKIDNVLSAEQVVVEVNAAAADRPIPLVVLTGGEPLRQNILPLIQKLVEDGYRVQIETAGTLWVEGLHVYTASDEVELVCSPKTPTLNEEVEHWCLHYKYIISAGEPAADDGLPFALTQARKELIQRNTGLERKKLYRPHREPRQSVSEEPVVIWLQPCDEGSELANERNRARCVELALKHGYRISLQTHKILKVE